MTSRLMALVRSGRVEVESTAPEARGDGQATIAAFDPYFLDGRERSSRFGFAFKRLFDICSASAALILFAPLMAFIFFKIRSDGGKAVFVQMRVGRNGTLFPCYKFRTMVPNAEQVLNDILEKEPELKKEWLAERKLVNDPRVTKLGEFLRRKSLDELPQLWNIVMGDMSVIGPRPIVPAEREKYKESIVHYESLRPGLTGAWQVSGRSTVSYDERVKLDSDYATQWSLRKDAEILFKTFGVVFRGDGAY